jgi:hypothetical protein
MFGTFLGWVLVPMIYILHPKNNLLTSSKGYIERRRAPPLA